MDGYITSEGTLLYHVSRKVEKEPYLRCSKDTKGFSWGFYCFLDEGQAIEESKKFGANAVINVYSLRDMNNLKVKTFNETDTEWFDFIISCKKGVLHDFDVVRGTLVKNIDECIQESIERNMLIESTKLEGKQIISFHTVKALIYLKYETSYIV